MSMLLLRDVLMAGEIFKIEHLISQDWLECMLTSYYLFIEHFKGDPDVQVRKLSRILHQKVFNFTRITHKNGCTCKSVQLQLFTTLSY